MYVHVLGSSKYCQIISYPKSRLGRFYIICNKTPSVVMRTYGAAEMRTTHVMTRTGTVNKETYVPNTVGVNESSS